MVRVRKAVVFTVIAAAVILGGGYFYTQRSANAEGAPGAGGQAQQAMPVSVVSVESNPVQIWNQYSARLVPVDAADIRPQVSGTIIEVKFEDGQEVSKGDVLYVIDPRPYEAAVNQAKAEVNVAKNQSSLTWKELKRAKELIKTNAISKRILDERSSAHSVAASSVKAAEAALESAQIHLDYAYVKAPIDGRVGRDEVRLGNLVQAGPNAPLLTSVVSTQGIHADFEVDEATYLKYIRSAARGREAEGEIPVRLILGADGSEYDGFIDSFDNRIDTSSGTIRARAYFPNKDGALLPGMFASVKLGTPAKEERIMIDEKAIGTDQSRKFVYVVNDQNMVEYREVKIGESVKGQRVIVSGLNVGEQVIDEGVIRIRPGMPVQPQGQSKKASNEMGQPPAQQSSESVSE